MGGASPGIRVVTAETIWEVDGPSERDPPQLSRLVRRAEPETARKMGRNCRANILELNEYTCTGEGMEE